MANQQEGIFIPKIQINNVRDLKDIEIPISDTERKHLILTGKNGSGKKQKKYQLMEFMI